MKRKITIVLLLSLSGQLSPFTTRQIKPLKPLTVNSKPNIYTILATHYLPVFTNESVFGLENRIESNQSLNQLSPAEQRQILFAMLSNYGTEGFGPYRWDKAIFHPEFWSNFELFCGPSNNRMNHVADTWNETITAVGDIVSKRILATPTTDIQILHKRQNVIRFLKTHKDLSRSLLESLTNIAKEESTLYSFWKTEDNSLKQDPFHFKNSLSSLNTNNVALAAKLHTENLMIGLGLIAPFLSYWLSNSGKHYINSENPSLPDSLFIHGPQSCKDGIQELINSCKENKAILAMTTGAAGLYALSSYQIIKVQKQKLALLKESQATLLSLATFIKEVSNISIELEKHSHIKKTIPNLRKIDGIRMASTELAVMTHSLRKAVKQGLSYFSNPGEILKVQKLIEKFKSHLVPVLEAIGELDAYLSMATMLQKSKLPFCFATYINGAQTPHLNIEHFWFPQLIQNKSIQTGEQEVVCNSVKMSHEKNGTKNIILTGLDGGGKTTILKSLTTSLILAQTYGIAPASYMRFTPMSTIQFHTGTPDRRDEGLSNSQAEQLRIQNLFKKLSQLRQNEFAFIVLDEILNKTTDEETVIISGIILEALRKFPNAMTIMTTHYDLLTKVEDYTNGFFKNYKTITDLNNENFKLNFSYTWTPETYTDKESPSDNASNFDRLTIPEKLRDEILKIWHEN